MNRKPQYLPVPIGELRPAPRRRLHPGKAARLWRLRGAELLGGCGILLAATAMLLSVSCRQGSIYLRGDHVYVDGAALVHPPGNAGVASGRVYTGPATLLILPGPDGEVTASAVTFLNGEKVTGVCRLDPPTSGQIVEHCQLRIGASGVACRDLMVLDTPGVWDRSCSDGKRLSITVPADGALIPMPFAVGNG